jgi:hypothetical protein
MKDANAGPPPEPSEEPDIEVETSPSFEESSAPSPATSRIVLEGDDRETCPRGIWPATVCDWVIEPDAYNDAQQNIFVYVLAETSEGPRVLWVKCIQRNSYCPRLFAMFVWLGIGSSQIAAGRRRLEVDLGQLVGCKVAVKVEDATFSNPETGEERAYVAMTFLRFEAAEQWSKSGESLDGQ